MVSIKEITTLLSSMNRKARRNYFKQHRQELLANGITWELLAAQFIGKGVIDKTAQI